MLTAAALSYYNYFHLRERCTLQWVQTAPDIVENPVILAQVIECKSLPGSYLYMRRVARKRFVVYLEDAQGNRSREVPVVDAAIGNFIRTIQLHEIRFADCRVRWTNAGDLATDQEKTTKVPAKLFFDTP